MGIDIQKGKTKALRFVPDAPMSAPTASVQTRAGVVLETPTATAHALSTTVATDADNSPTYLKLTSVAGLAAGNVVLVTDQTFGTAQAVVAGVSGSYVTFVTPFPATPDAGSTLVVLDVTLTVGTTSTAALAMDNIVIVSAGQEEVTELFNVVTHVYRGPLTARDVRDHIARLYAGEYAGATVGDDDYQWHAMVADEVNGNLRGRLLESSAYVSRYWDPDTLNEAARIMLRLVLADKGYWTGDGDREDQLRSLRLELKERIGGILKSGYAYDADASGDIDDDEVDGSTTIRGLR